MNMPDLKPINGWLGEVRQNPPPPDLVDDIITDSSEVNAIVGRSEIGQPLLKIQI